MYCKLLLINSVESLKFVGTNFRGLSSFYRFVGRNFVDELVGGRVEKKDNSGKLILFETSYLSLQW